MKVAIIDDNADDVSSLQRILAPLNLQTYAFIDGRDALDWLAFHPVDVVLLDLDMPAISGIDTASQIRCLAAHQHTQIIFVSGVSNSAHRGRALRAGGSAILTKPLDPDWLLAQLEVVGRYVDSIRQLSEAHDSARHLAFTDPLTGLLNRHGLDNRLQLTLATSTSLSLLFLDLNDLKGVNDRDGHAIGDRHIQEVASAMQTVFRRESDLCVRMGGDEFLAVVPESDAELAIDLAKRVCTVLRSSNARLGSLKVSVGIAVMDADPQPHSVLDHATFSELLTIAGANLLEAKQKALPVVTSVLKSVDANVSAAHI